MTVLLAIVVVATLGIWIPLSQLIPGTPERSLLVYVAIGNVVFSGLALLVSGAHLTFGWRDFWLPLAGGVLWTGGNYCVSKASKAIGLARAAGTWTPLNIVVAFVWGALLFGELDGFSAARFAILGAAFVAVVAGVLLIAGSREDPSPGAMSESGRRTTSAAAGLLWAGGAGILWGTYFVPAQWAKVPAQVSDFPLALGILAAALVLALPAGEPVKLSGRATGSLLGAGVLFGIGNLALLALVARVGTGTGFTIAQLSLLVNASVGVWVFRVPEPGTRQAHKVLAGIVLAGIGGCAIAAMR
jgi:glucose uptake protein GlcU